MLLKVIIACYVHIWLLYIILKKVEDVKWTDVYKDYSNYVKEKKDQMDKSMKPQHKAMAFSTLCLYQKHIFPNYRTNIPTRGKCEVCNHLFTSISDLQCTTLERDTLFSKMNIDHKVAVQERKSIKDFLMNFINSSDFPSQSVSFPSHLNNDIQLDHNEKKITVEQTKKYEEFTGTLEELDSLILPYITSV